MEQVNLFDVNHGYAMMCAVTMELPSVRLRQTAAARRGRDPLSPQTNTY